MVWEWLWPNHCWRGAKVILTGRNPKNVEIARRELGEHAHVIPSDVSLMTDIDALGAYVAERFGEIDFVHINAGIALLEPFTEVTESSYDKTFDVNTKGHSLQFSVWLRSFE